MFCGAFRSGRRACPLDRPCYGACRRHRGRPAASAPTTFSTGSPPCRARSRTCASPAPGSADDKTGVYRVVIARTVGEAVTARLFVQWIAYDDDGSATVEHTIEIKELADLELDIVDYTSESDADGLSVFIQTLNPNGDTDQNYELFVLSPTEYRFGPASN